jgi:hypothetical protein
MMMQKFLTRHRFTTARRGSVAVEFALLGLAVVGFLFVIVNLGVLGLDIATLARTVQATGRWAAVSATASYAASGGTITEPCLGSVVTVFNNYGAPPLPTLAAPGSSAANGTQTSGALTLQTSWSGGTGAAPGVYLTLAATYNWRPFGYAKFGTMALPIRIVTAATVMGSPLSGASVSSSCN